MELQSKKNIDALLEAANVATGLQKNLNLKSAINTLLDGISGTQPATNYEEDGSVSGGAVIESGKRLAELLRYVNKRSGQNFGDITEAMNWLCKWYQSASEPPLYSFGLLSDTHIQYETGLDDFQRALTYFDDVTFICICGDLISYADSTTMGQYKQYVDTYASVPVYECAGNHETFPSLGVGGTLDTTLWKNTTGKDPYYFFEYAGDVFIFLSNFQHTPNNLFPEGGLEWLENTLEANKNKRCFVFQHIPQSSVDKAADPSNSYDAGMMEGTDGKAFIALLKQYKNTVWFHGHTHVKFYDEYYPLSDRNVLGYRSVHVPSLSSLRFYDKENNSISDSYINENGNTIWGATLAEGYKVEVYKNKIVLFCLNFAAGAMGTDVQKEGAYILDTTLQVM